MKTYGFALAIILGIGGLAAGGIGLAGYLGQISHLDHVRAIIMMAAGGGGGIALFIIGVVGSVKNCKKARETGVPAFQGNSISTGGGGRQTEFPEETRRGEIRHRPPSKTGSSSREDEVESVLSEVEEIKKIMQNNIERMEQNSERLESIWRGSAPPAGG